jgi:hypothetical protein
MYVASNRRSTCIKLCGITGQAGVAITLYTCIRRGSRVAGSNLCRDTDHSVLNFFVIFFSTSTNIFRIVL